MSVFSQAQLDPPTNNTCGGAIITFAHEDCQPQTFSTQNATRALPDGFCGGNADDDVYFRFFATSQRMEIRVTGQGSFDATIQHFVGSCGALTPQLCEDATGPGETEVKLIENLVPGNNYYYRVFDRGAIADQTDFLFDVCVVELPVNPISAQDFPCVAVTPEFKLIPDGTVHYFNNEFNGLIANEDLVTPTSGVCDPYDYSGWCSTDPLQNTAWFAFEATAPGVFIDACNGGLGTDIPTQMALYSASNCDDFTTFTFLAGNETSPDCSLGSQLSYCSLTPGETYFILVDGFEGAIGTFGLSIQSIEEPVAGTGDEVDLCKNDPAFDLFSVLFDANPGGHWLDLDDTGELIDGFFNAFGTPAGTYTFGYLIEGFACFDNDTAFVVVTTPELPNPGNNSGVAACASATPLPLFDYLNGTPEEGGVWRDPNGVLHSGDFVGTTDPEGFYTYILPSADGACPGDSVYATVLVEIIPGGDAGVNGSVTKCTNDQPFEMIDYLGGTPDPNGTWYTTSSQIIDPLFDPAVQPAGNYIYVVEPPGCDAAVSQLSVNLTNGPQAGEDGSATLCFDDDALNMGSLLGGTPEPGGEWFDPDGNPTSNQYNPADDVPGVYTYVVTGGTCPADTAEVTMDTTPEAMAGDNGSTTVCETAEGFDLFPLLGGAPDASGSWSDPNGDAFGGFFDPASSSAGEYTYTVVGLCNTASATVTVSVDAELNAGTAGDSAACYNADPFALFDVLGGSPDVGGTWEAPDGNPFGGTFNPAEDVEGTYTYVLDGGTCGEASAEVSITVTPAVNAGTDATLEACDSDPSTELFTLLGEDAQTGGTWTDPNGDAFENPFNPAEDPAGTYTYTLVGTCNTSTAAVDVNLLPNVNAGNDATLETCENDPGTNLFALLGEDAQAGGSWTDPDGELYENPFNPAEDPAGTYTYTLVGACNTSAASVVVSINPLPDPGEALGEYTLTFDEGSIDLFTRLMDPEAGGTWTDDDGSGGLDGSVFTGTGAWTGQTFNFTYTVTNGCGSQSITIAIYVDFTDNIGDYRTLEFDIYPNPVTDRITLSGEALWQPLTVTIYSVTGEVQLETQISPSGREATLNVTSLPPGTYLLKLTNQDGVQGTHTLIKH